MKTILVSAYAVNPYKGSEEGTGWNLISQIAGFNHVIAVTRKNNRGDIERYMREHPDMQELFGRMTFLYFDLPKWAIAWKKGPLLSALYFYIWQFSIARWLKKKNLQFDIAHSLNFHSNWTPSFLWMLGKPFVWGPVGNHPLIPAQYIRRPYGTKAYLKDRMLWAVKWCFWNLDPFLYMSRKKAEKVFCVNTQAAEKLRLPDHKVIPMPAVASEPVEPSMHPHTGKFMFLSVGRFVPLKGFDLAILAFSDFCKRLPEAERERTGLQIIGTGPEKARLRKLIQQEQMEGCIEITEWMPRSEVVQVFSRSDAYLFPSHEGAGMVVPEAMSYGLPVICLDNFGPGEYVPPASTLRVAHGGYQETIRGLADKMYQLYQDDQLYSREIQLALKHFNRRFQWKHKGRLMEAAYASVEAEA